MFTNSKLIRHSSAVFMSQCRCKTKIHWAKLKKKNTPKDKALEHFDEFYGSVFENNWEPIKKALLRNQKYVALVNNYGDTEETTKLLINRGAHAIEKLYQVEKEFQAQHGPRYKTQVSEKPVNTIEKLEEISQNKELASLYPDAASVPEVLQVSDVVLGNKSEEIASKKTDFIPSQQESSEQAAELTAPAVQIDETRLIESSIGMSSGALWQYVPASKLKGKDDWIPESQHYSYYSKAKDFPLIIEPETELVFPHHLKVYSYEAENLETFPEPRRCSTGVFNYYPMDGASIMPVLALGLTGGERVLDLCSGPGGKALVALQTLLPDVVVCNDISISRANRIQRVFKDYLIDFEESNKWRERTVITKVDGRIFKDEQLFDKVLVDVPCTTDRHSVKESENNIFRPDRLKERLRIPELQAQLLVNALSLTKVGGALVYSTCSLSPVQNDGVVHMALKQAFEQHGIQAVIRDMTACMEPFWGMMRFGRGNSAPRYGQLVVPHVAANFGPAYFSKIVRLR